MCGSVRGESIPVRRVEDRCGYLLSGAVLLKGKFVLGPDNVNA